MARMDLGMDGIEAAAQSGAGDALFELGMLYSTGLDVEANLVVAHKWFNLAAMRGSKPALERRKELALEMSSAEIAEAQKLAREWLATERLATERRDAERQAIEAFAREHAGTAARAEAPEAPGRELPEPSNVVWLRARSLAA